MTKDKFQKTNFKIQKTKGAKFKKQKTKGAKFKKQKTKFKGNSTDTKLTDTKHIS